MNRGLIAISIALIGLIVMGVLGSHINKESEKSEIIEHEYYSLLLKYDYLSGSEAGKDFNQKLSDYFKDGVITEKEYKLLTGDNPTPLNLSKPEIKKLEEGAKDRLIAKIKN